MFQAVRSNNTLTVPGFESESSDEEYCKLDGGGEDLEANNGGHFNLGPEAPANYNYGRRRSRAVLYQLSGHYKTDKASKKIHSKLNANVSLTASHHHATTDPFRGKLLQKLAQVRKLE